MSDEEEIKKKSDELTKEELEKAAGGAVNAYLIIDGRPGPSVEQPKKQLVKKNFNPAFKIQLDEVRRNDVGGIRSRNLKAVLRALPCLRANHVALRHFSR